MNRRDFFKFAIRGVSAIVAVNLLPVNLDEKKTKIYAIVADESSISKYELHNTDCLEALKKYCKKDVELAWDMHYANFSNPIFEGELSFMSAYDRLVEARLEAKRTGKAQLMAQQKRNINEMYGKYVGKYND